MALFFIRQTERARKKEGRRKGSSHLLFHSVTHSLVASPVDGFFEVTPCFVLWQDLHLLELIGAGVSVLLLLRLHGVFLGVAGCIDTEKTAFCYFHSFPAFSTFQSARGFK